MVAVQAVLPLLLPLLAPPASLQLQGGQHQTLLIPGERAMEAESLLVLLRHEASEQGLRIRGACTWSPWALFFQRCRAWSQHPLIFMAEAHTLLSF